MAFLPITILSYGIGTGLSTAGLIATHAVASQSLTAVWPPLIVTDALHLEQSILVLIAFTNGSCLEPGNNSCSGANLGLGSFKGLSPIALGGRFIIISANLS